MNVKNLQKALEKKNIDIKNIKITENKELEDLIVTGEINGIYFEKIFLEEDYEKVKNKGIKYFISNMEKLYKELNKINLIKEKGEWKFLKFDNLKLPFGKKLEGDNTYMILSKNGMIKKMQEEYDAKIEAYGGFVGDNSDWYEQMFEIINKLPENTIIIYDVDESQIYLPGEKFFMDILQEIGNKKNMDLNSMRLFS